MIRAASISREMKRRVATCLFGGCMSFCVVLLIWARACRLIDASWLVVLSPLLILGGMTLMILLSDCVVLLLAMGRFLVARSDKRARRNFTIRNSR